MVGVLSMCPPHHFSQFPTSRHLCRPAQTRFFAYLALHGLHTTLCTLPCTSAHCHGMTPLLPFLISFSLCLCPAPSPSPSESIQPHPPAFHCLHSNSEVYLCNYAMSMLGLALD